MKKYGISIIIIFLIVVLFVININAILYEHNYIKLRSEQGNNRWAEVENRILNIENRIDDLEKRVYDGRNG